MRFLVVGAGSIGTRHAGNLRILGAEVATMDPVREADYKKLGTALLEFHPDAAVIATPTHRHIEVALRITGERIPMFIEKPVSHNLRGVAQLQRLVAENDTFAAVGYSMRFHPALQAVKAALPKIGQPLYARAEVGQYLPDWHPTEDYRQWYMAHEEQGGGALLDLSHEIDALSWLLGPLSAPEGLVGHFSDLDITSDDLAEFTAVFQGGIASVHMNLLDKIYHRSLRIIGTDGTIDWDFDRATVLHNHHTIEYATDRNIQFVEEMRHFMWSVYSGHSDGDLATLDEGVATLELVMELKEQNGR